MTRQLKVFFLPQLMADHSLTGETVVVIDVLRATTTIITALDRGAHRVIPAAQIDDAHEIKRRLNGDAILGGERGGVIIPGFDQGNSPLEFTPTRIAGRTLVLCTTNGTVALSESRLARRVLVGAFVNLSALTKALEADAAITILCSGTNRKITSEDVLFAGALTDRLLQQDPHSQLNDQGQVALAYWLTTTAKMAQGHELADELAAGAGGRNLLKLGYRADIDFCARIDEVPRVAELDLASWEIRLGNN